MAQTMANLDFEERLAIAQSLRATLRDQLGPAYGEIDDEDEETVTDAGTAGMYGMPSGYGTPSMYSPPPNEEALLAREEADRLSALLMSKEQELQGVTAEIDRLSAQHQASAMQLRSKDAEIGRAQADMAKLRESLHEAEGWLQQKDQKYQLAAVDLDKKDKIGRAHV